jgi:hypothetical protein
VYYAGVGRWQSDHPAFAKGVVLRFVGEGNTPSHTKVYLIYYFTAAAAKGVVLRFVGEGNTPSHTKVCLIYYFTTALLVLLYYCVLRAWFCGSWARATRRRMSM